MAINITNILNAITAKNNNADSTYSNFELSQINRAVNTINSENGVITFNSASDLPSGDSALIGQIAFVSGAFNIDSTNDSVRSSHTGSFYYYNGDSWGIAILTADSDYLNPSADPYSFQGSVSGYAAGGSLPAYTNVIQKYPYTADANSTDVGDLLSIIRWGAGQSSTTHGYVSGGSDPSQAPNISNRIQKYSFTADGNSTDVANLTINRQGASGQNNEINGYSSGGRYPSSPTSNIIDKFPFSVDANATDVGDLTVVISYNAGQSSTENGYKSGGSPYTTVIDKFPFASDANATQVGILTRSVGYHAGQSSTENGYTSGGHPPFTNIIDKFPFASDANATDVGDLTAGGYGATGTSSANSGYTQGGRAPAITNVIDKFSFATDANATDVGDLLAANHHTTGNQV
jgi:hypothetical protein